MGDSVNEHQYLLSVNQPERGPGPPGKSGVYSVSASRYAVSFIANCQQAELFGGGLKSVF